MDLRPYQQDCLKAIESKLEDGINRQLVVLPTGSGKTVIFSELIKRKNLKTLVIAHRIELLEQAKDKLSKVAPDISSGIFCGDQKCHEKQVTIASIQSAINALDLLKSENYQLLIIDEAHHAVARTYIRLIEALGFKQVEYAPDVETPEISDLVKPYLQTLGVECSKASPQRIKKSYRLLAIKYHPDKNNGDIVCAERFKRIQEAYEFLAKSKNLLLDNDQVERVEDAEKDLLKPAVVDRLKFMVGFTATPKRGDNIGLDEVFQEIPYAISIRKLVNRGFLVKPEGLHVKVGIDLKKVQIRGGDYKIESLRKVMLSKQARDIVVQTIKRFAPDRRGIVFSVDIEHSELLKKDFQEAGFSCDAVHSSVSLEDRKARLKAFESGELQFIVNPMILTEGFDCPVADCMINVAPTQNRSLYIQKAGRVLRTHPDKENALLIDFGITKKKHTLVTAVDLMGDDIVMRTVTDREELYPKQKKEKPIDEDLEFTEEEYNPLDGKTGKITPIYQKDGSHLTAFDSKSRVLNHFTWKRERISATASQRDYIRKLCKATGERVEHMERLGIGQAKKIISYLLEKKKTMQKGTPITKKQAWYLKKLAKEQGVTDLDDSKIYNLSKYEARGLIGKMLGNVG
uniref:DnaJ domain-containing protein n=1 Tax=Candidatus Kentrum sp. SD TaxID=2126332 RepID=A0A450Z6A7_9GAMM|nr:MAG: DnaJ domain-containing protein [Candidatus Kentron sp. SD]VFK49350.1 MAG: DnaJ domain-containing protein [Candidatus Kentron sp. SD]VFK80873.1 MAG: DnaJ domain-containing protein [Candidatus Kentron sp. SD]